MIAIQASERNGNLVGAILVDDLDEVMLISTRGVLIRTKVAQIREQGRTTQGVTLIALGEGEKLAGLERVVERDEEITNGNGEIGANGANGTSESGPEQAPGIPPTGGTEAQ